LHRVIVLQVKAQLPDRDILALVQSRRRIRGRATVNEGGVLALVVGARIGSQEELIQGRKRAAAEVSKAIGRREKEPPVPEDVERVEEREFLEVRPERYDVLPPEPGEVVCELPYVLFEDIVDGKRLVAHGRVGDASITDLDGGEGFAERLPEIPEPVVARKEAIREAARAAVELQRERVEMVVDRVAGVLERQTGRVRSAPGV